MIAKEYIIEAVNDILGHSGFFLVDVQVSRGNLIRVFMDHPNGISLDDCAFFSGKIEQKLDREQEDFELQVSSPGLGEPIRVIEQYRKSIGQKLDIRLVDGDSLKGRLESLREGPGEPEPALVIKLAGSKRKPAPAEPAVIGISRIHLARIEIDFKQV